MQSSLPYKEHIHSTISLEMAAKVMHFFEISGNANTIIKDKYTQDTFLLAAGLVLSGLNILFSL